jgi:hypothetical protein
MTSVGKPLAERSRMRCLPSVRQSVSNSTMSSQSIYLRGTIWAKRRFSSLRLDRKNEQQRSCDVMSDDIDPRNGTMETSPRHGGVGARRREASQPGFTPSLAVPETQWTEGRARSAFVAAHCVRPQRRSSSPTCDLSCVVARGGAAAPSVHRGDLKFSKRLSTLFSVQAVCPPPDRSHAACFYLLAGSIAGEMERASPFSSLLRRRRRR